MRLLFFLSLFTLTALSCENSSKPLYKKSFTAFDFTYSNPVKLTFYSIKFTDGDTIFVQQNFPSMLDSSYYAMLSREDRIKADNLINSIDLSMLDTSYEEGYLDGEAYQFYFQKDTIRKSIYVHSNNIPKELNNFRIWLKEMKNNLNLIAMDTTIYFESQKQFSLPKVHNSR